MVEQTTSRRLSAILEKSGGEAAIGDRFVDARQILIHDPASTNIDMPNFGVTKLTFGQADITAAGAQKRVWAICPNPVEGRGVGLVYRVIGIVFTPAPAIQDTEHYWFFGGLLAHLAQPLSCRTLSLGQAEPPRIIK